MVARSGGLITLMIIPQDFDAIASGIQHLATAAGIVVGGIWVLYTFWGQRVIQKASLDVARTKVEIGRIEQDAAQQPVLSMVIRPGITIDEGYPISITAVFRNDGKLAMSFEDSKLSLMRVFDEKGSHAGNVQPIKIKALMLESGGALSNMPLRILRAGQERNLAFVLPKLSAGAYFIELRTKYAGMQIIDGHFKPSSDDTIEAIEQTVLMVPTKASLEVSKSQPFK